MKTILNQVERDFVEFLTMKKRQPYEKVQNDFLSTRNQFKFSSLAYRELCVRIHDLFKVVYDDGDEKDIIDAYKFHDVMHLFRFIAYSYPKADTGIMDYLTFLTRVIYRREFGRISDFAKQKLAGKKSAVGASATYDAIARLLAGSIAGEPVVVDYGCGLGYISFEIGMMRRLSKTYLVDIDCLTLEFAEFRFKKHGLNVETIPISKNRIYPELPTHNICIATEVMEHVFQPLTVYANICGALEPGGILYGDFGDHHHEMFHVSPDLSQLRVSIQRDFQRLDDLCYRKLG